MTSTSFFLFFIPLLAIILLAVNLIFAPHMPYSEKDSAFECGFHSFLGQNRTQFSISFFVFALLFLLFDLEILLIYPYALSAYTNSVYGLVVMLIFFLALTLGFAFELGKNALKIESRQTINLKVISNFLLTFISGFKFKNKYIRSFSTKNRLGSNNNNRLPPMLNNSSTSNNNTNLPPLSEVLSEINNTNRTTITQSNTSVTAVDPNNVTGVPNVDTMIAESKTDSDNTPSESVVSDSQSDTDSGIGGEHPDQDALDNDPDQLIDYPVEKLTERNLRIFIAETKEGGKYPESIGIRFKDRNDPGGQRIINQWKERNGKLNDELEDRKDKGQIPPSDKASDIGDSIFYDDDGNEVKVCTDYPAGRTNPSIYTDENNTNSKTSTNSNPSTNPSSNSNSRTNLNPDNQTPTEFVQELKDMEMPDIYESDGGE